MTRIFARGSPGVVCHAGGETVPHAERSIATHHGRYALAGEQIRRRCIVGSNHDDYARQRLAQLTQSSQPDWRTVRQGLEQFAATESPRGAGREQNAADVHRATSLA